MHLLCFGETNRPTYQPFDPRPQVDMLALDFLGLVLANTMLLGIKMTLVPNATAMPCSSAPMSTWNL